MTTWALQGKRRSYHTPLGGSVLGWMIVMMACGGRDEPTLCESPGTQVATPRAAGCLAVRDGRLLMVQGKDGRWSIPAGFVESGENSAAAAVRETLEEASVDVIAGPPVCAVVAKRFVAHQCTVQGPPRPSGDGKETLDAEFLTADELRALPASALRFPDQRAAYLRAVEGDVVRP